MIRLGVARINDSLQGWKFSVLCGSHTAPQTLRFNRRRTAPAVSVGRVAAGTNSRDRLIGAEGVIPKLALPGRVRGRKDAFRLQVAGRRGYEK